MVVIDPLPINTPSLKICKVMGSAPLNILQTITTVGIPDDGRVMFCPHVNDARKPGKINGGKCGDDKTGSPMKRLT